MVIVSVLKSRIPQTPIIREITKRLLERSGIPLNFAEKSRIPHPGVSYYPGMSITMIIYLSFYSTGFQQIDARGR